MEDEMDSLFEGMVLFTPAQLSPEQPPSLERPAPHDRPQQEDVPLQSVSSEPLDENLFSDLTIVENGDSSDQIRPEDGGDRSSSSVSVQPKSNRSVEARGIVVTSLGRQVSRKKKRATGLRIGYGRESVVSSGVLAEHSPDASPSDRVNTETRDVAASRSGGIDVPVTATSSKEEERISKEFSSEVQSDNNDLEVPRDLENSGASTMNSAHHDKNEEILVTEGADDRKELDDVVESDDAVEEKFEKLKEQISSKLDNSSTVAASLLTARKECVRRRRKAAESLSLASSQYKELEKQLEEACEAEDFEMADKVSEMLGAADSQRQELVDALRDAVAECDAIDVKMDELLHARIVAEEECISLMEDFSAVSLSDEILLFIYM
ncbi:hypothetical protein MLD38_012791 [Melastoma candidum]|uniref:Uncharacterized protein n=1 Tax=Melastoma candidum TaxID=119954 RepID=A0ACB9R7G5_9MYRT|nr:hypothetical protein MLD38_012791 [Melastoma candidum]